MFFIGCKIKMCFQDKIIPSQVFHHNLSSCTIEFSSSEIVRLSWKTRDNLGVPLTISV